jgi:SAM-dependent methyltransferase
MTDYFRRPKAPNPASLCDADPILNLFHNVTHLDNIYRKGYGVRGVDEKLCESDSEHSYHVAIWAYTLAKLHNPELDLLTVLEYALAHEWGEIYNGDLMPGEYGSIDEKLTGERASLRRVLKDHPLANHFTQVLERYYTQADAESRFVDQIDRLQMADRAGIYKQMGYQNMDAFFPYVDERVQEPNLKNFLKKIVALSKPLSAYDSSMADYWSQIIRDRRDDFRTYVSDPALFARIPIDLRGKAVLDAGCGEGYVTRLLAQRGAEAIGIDSSISMINAAKGAAIGPERYITTDVRRMPFADSRFDAVVSNFVLMELAKPEDALREISRVLQPGGQFIFQILHPFTYTSTRGSNVGQRIGDYFCSERFSDHFNVDGLISPKEGIWFHHPMSAYTCALNDKGFSIDYMDEPKPMPDTPSDNPLWQVFKEPWIWLVDARKRK